MIESIRTISKALEQTNQAFMCLKDLSDVLFSGLDSMNKSFSNSFQIQRILNDQFRGSMLFANSRKSKVDVCCN